MMSKSQNINYQTITTASVQDETLDVTFGDGEHAVVLLSRLLPADTQLTRPVKLEVSSVEVIIATSAGPYVIPWDRLRILTDDEFANEMAEEAEKNARTIGQKIRSLRERQDITAKKLAERAGITAQTITRIERGHTDVSFATLKKILSAMGYGLADLAIEEENEEMEIKPLTYTDLVKKVGVAGVDQTLLRKILPEALVARVAAIRGHIPELLRHEIALYLGKIFNWSENAIWSGHALEMKFSPAQTAYFKTPSVGNIRQIRAYSHYAYYIAEVVTRINNREPAKEYPGDLQEFSQTFYSVYLEFTFEKLLDYAWDMGIAVIPLTDSGIFHGASWNIKGRHVIILKQRVLSHARWMYDLLHELYHVFAHLEEPDTSVVEWEDLNPYATHLAPEELEANAFAEQFVFGTMVSEYVKEVLETANFKMELLKKALTEVADKKNVRADFLANYLAFRLQSGGKNWWATASSFQLNEPSPAAIASKKLYERVSLETLNAIDYNIVTAAINL